MKYQLKEFNRNIPDEDLLNDLKTVAEKLKISNLSSRQYKINGGKYTAGTISLRFGTWNNALEKAGLGIVHQRNVSEEDLFKNLEELWIKIGRQPVFRDLQNPISKYSSHQYTFRFGTWRKSLESFIGFINSNNEVNEEIVEEEKESETPKDEIIFQHKTKRLPSERLKVQVLMRDGNKCRLCGITLTGDNIHFDHILPWSKGGETTLDNLQILCELHNLAKGNYVPTEK